MEKNHKPYVNEKENARIRKIVDFAKEEGLSEPVDLDTFRVGYLYGLYYGDWRSVKNELPTTNQEVLADVEFDTGYGLCHDYCIAHYDLINGQWYTRERQPINVVNWLPLPELPKVE